MDFWWLSLLCSLFFLLIILSHIFGNFECFGHIFDLLTIWRQQFFIFGDSETVFKKNHYFGPYDWNFLNFRPIFVKFWLFEKTFCKLYILGTTYVDLIILGLIFENSDFLGTVILNTYYLGSQSPDMGMSHVCLVKP